MALTLIGTGFGRTGTLSVKIALEKLRRSRCYHMAEVFVNPGHIEQWLKASGGEKIDWDIMFQNYSACVDWPSCYFWRELVDHYPDAKVLLTVRDPETWYESVMNTVYIGMAYPTTKDPLHRAQLNMARQIVLNQHFKGRFEDRDYAIDVFNQHIETVKNTVSKDRLLIFKASDGWQPLCTFLEVSVPEDPFPYVNTTEQFRSSCFFQKGEIEDDNRELVSRPVFELKN